MRQRPLTWTYFAIGAGISAILVLGLPFWFGVCFFLIGSESDPFGPILFISYVDAIILVPIAGGLIGMYLQRISKGTSTANRHVDPPAIKN